MNVAMARTLLGYHHWAWARAWACVDALDADGFTRDVGFSLGTARAHLVHSMMADAMLGARMVGAPPPPLPDTAADGDTHTTREAWATVDAFREGLAGALSDEMLVGHVQRKGPSAPFWVWLVHMVNHGVDHRAQLFATLHTLGAPTAEHDLIFYLRAPERVSHASATLDAGALAALLAYTDRATRRLLDCARALDQAALHQDTGYAWSSVAGQLAHMADTHLTWAARVQGDDAVPPKDASSDSMTVDDFAAQWQNAHQAALDVLHTHTGDLSAAVRYSNSRGEAFVNTAGEVLLHLVTHGTDHRAQTLFMLHMLGAPTFEQDLLLDWWAQHPQG